MSSAQELSSWFAPKGTTTASHVPEVGSQAPTTALLPLDTGKPTIIAFLRHYGCPFAEKTYLRLRDCAKQHRDLDFVAISHSSNEATNTWLKALPQTGSEPGNLRVIVDDKLELYSAYGLGASSFAHVLSPSSFYEVWRMGSQEGIWNRPTESGSRWQTSGFFAIDSEGVVRWGRAAQSADDVPDFEEAAEAVGGSSAVKANL
ncbi:hypothetical protein BAUCODRAFT_490543 [Baudoinia panamericana UAMH 10762]|uniref:Thioredoxin domain-containing protein n=1 Tax=Baudoinia panamericana (strain UAMH 10762) TaxID=717646 RepID=M2ND14_BAUPA|nr:uncharacterized protein BAUCODRAFT_490543 [Baudoinia panamericana UAMH 10762]EMC96815.1 hypothetical protein BAUCODRAFT_490543 [Baudoinia panamericana UAMH 10762]